MVVSNQCLCGRVRYQGDAEPRFQVKCYCTDCRKVNAAGHAAIMGFPTDAIRVKGEVKEHHSRADSGSDVTRAFCPACGAGIYARNEAMPGMIFLSASTLDDPNLFAPQLVDNASRAPAWNQVLLGVPAFAEGPPGN